MTIITETPRLIVREFLPEEKDLFFNLMTDTRINSQLPKRSPGEIREVFIEIISHYLQGFKLTRWGVFEALTGDFIGLGLLKFDPDEPQKAELGYVLHLNYHGKGLATELSKALITYGFKQMKLNEIFAVTTHQNIASQRVLLKAGLVQGPHIQRGGMELSFFKIKRKE